MGMFDGIFYGFCQAGEARAWRDENGDFWLQFGPRETERYEAEETDGMDGR
jgi:hypothetical protein